MPTPWQLSATQLIAGFEAGEFTPVDALQACNARLAAINPKLNAVVVVNADGAQRAAALSTARWREGKALGPLDGVPITVKDSLFTVDMPTSWGTPALRHYQTGHDELAVARARAGGAVIVGKTNVPEFALEGYTANPIYGVTGNPWAPHLTPGGSSGGAVAAVAAGIAPLAIGQDGGGSIRRPASHTGVVGLKPSLSAWPRQHVLPSLLLDFEVIGPVARTVADTRLLFDALRGPVAVDRSSLAAAQAISIAQRQRLQRQQGQQQAPLQPLRILYVERLGDAPLDPQIAASVGRSVSLLESLGHHVEFGPLPLDLDFFSAAWPQIGQIGLAQLFDSNPDWQAQASARYVELAESGRRLPATRLLQIVTRVTELRRASAALFESIDLIVMPSAAALPWSAQEPYPTQIDGQEVGPRGHAIYTGWVNAAGLPALALPATPSAEGLPIGLQLIGPFGADYTLLEVGAAYERIAPWAQRWPVL